MLRFFLCFFFTITQLYPAFHFYHDGGTKMTHLHNCKSRLNSTGPNFMKPVSTKICLARNFFLGKTGLPTQFPLDFQDLANNSWIPVSSNMQQMKIWLVIQFLPRKKFHAKQIFVLTQALWSVAQMTSYAHKYITADQSSNHGKLASLCIQWNHCIFLLTDTDREPVYVWMMLEYVNMWRTSLRVLYVPLTLSLLWCVWVYKGTQPLIGNRETVDVP